MINNRSGMSGESSSNIRVRSIKPDLNDQTNRFWFGKNPFLTHLMNSLSFVFPPGEETFVDSVNYYREQIRDPQLRLAIRGFASQEYIHSHLHEKLNDWIGSQSPVSKVYAARLKTLIEVLYKFYKGFSPKAALGTTAGFEHLTAIMAASLLQRRDVLGMMEPEIGNIFVLHAIEEIEHKDVALDVYRQVGGGEILRILTFIGAVFMLIAMTLVTTIGLLFHERKSLNLKFALDFLKVTVGTQGFFTGLIPNALKYFKPSFHPSQLQDQELLHYWNEELSHLTQVKIIGRTKKTDELGSQEVGA